MQGALGRLAVRRYRLAAGLVLALAAINCFAYLGAVAVNDSDEARYGVSALEMVRSHHYLVTTYAWRPEYWNLKPPLGYWLIALSFKVFGANAFALRVPSALAALGTIALTLYGARRWLGRRASLVAAAVLATTFGFLSNHGARAGDLDAPLTFVLLAAALQIPRLAEARWRPALFALWLALGFLIKDFAIAPIVLVAALYLLLQRREIPLARGPWLVAAAVFFLPVGTWTLARAQADGSFEFVRRMVFEDVYLRTRFVIDHVTSSPLDYVWGLLDRFAPWPLLIAVAAGLAFRRRARWRRAPEMPRRPQALLLALWTLLPLVIFSAAKTHHHWYLDPTYPAWAMIAAVATLWLIRIAPAGRKRAVALLVIFLPLALAEARFALRLLEDVPAGARQRASIGRRAAAAPQGAPLRTGPLRHSERFLFEATFGRQVIEGPGEAASVARGLLPPAAVDGQRARMPRSGG